MHGHFYQPNTATGGVLPRHVRMRHDAPSGKITDWHHRSLLRTCQKHERSGILSRLVAGKKDLETWWEGVADEIYIETPSHQPSSRMIKHIQLESALVRMFIGRPLLLNRLSTGSTPASPEGIENRSASTSANHTETSQGSHLEARKQLIDCCIRAAQEALRVCRTLRDTRPGLARSSYIEYSSCRASLLALIAHSIRNQTARLRSDLRDGLDMIREMAAAGDSARSEVALLESLEGALTLLQYSSEASGTGNSGTQNGSSEDCHSGYEGFKYWESQFKSAGAANVLPTASAPVGSGILPAEDQIQRIQEQEDNLFGPLPRSFSGYVTAPALGTDPLTGHPGPAADLEDYYGILPSSQDILHPDFWN